MRPKVLSANLLQCGLLSPWSHRFCQGEFPKGLQPPLGIPLLQYRSPPWAAGGSLHTYGSPWAAGTQLLHLALHPRLHRNLSSSSWTISSPISSTDLGDCKAVSHTFFFTPFFHGHNYLCSIIFLFSTADGFSLELQQTHLGANWLWLCQTWGKLPAASHRSHPLL